MGPPICHFNSHFPGNPRLAGSPLSSVSRDPYPQHRHRKGKTLNIRSDTILARLLWTSRLSSSLNLARLTQSTSSLCSTCPNQRNLPLIITRLTGSSPSNSLSFVFFFLSLKLTLRTLHANYKFVNVQLIFRSKCLSVASLVCLHFKSSNVFHAINFSLPSCQYSVLSSTATFSFCLSSHFSTFTPGWSRISVVNLRDLLEKDFLHVGCPLLMPNQQDQSVEVKLPPLVGYFDFSVKKQYLTN